MHHPLRSAGVRRATVVGVTLVLVASLTTPAFGANDSLSAAQASITAAQEASDRASAAYDAATARYYQLQDDAVSTRAAVATARAAQQSLVSVVRERAVQLYIRAGSTGFDVFRSTGGVLDASRRVTLAAAANSGDDVAIGNLRAATDDLNARQATLRSELSDEKAALADLQSHQEALQRAVDDATRAEHQLRVRLESERRASEYDALVQRAHDAARHARTSGKGSDNSSNDGSQPTTDGSGAAPQIIASGDWVCPVQGGSSFTDTFGAPRGNGRTHKGVDMFAPIGTPLVAVVSGSVFFQSDPLGGLAAYVQGNDGNTYYYAHLNDYVGGARSVSGGELIGHLGNTGDASDAPPQLHFEIRPGGPNGIAIDPYPTVRAHC